MSLAGGEPLPLEDLARLRGGAYRLFGVVLLYPDAEWIATLPRVAEGLLPESRPFEQFAFWGRWERLLGSLGRLREADRAALESVYVNDFSVSSGTEGCPPRESDYLPRDAAAPLMAELEGEYARCGFSLAPSLDEPSDHAAVELEFMSLLCGREAEAWERRSLGDGVGHLGRQRRFLLQHLSRWFPAFARRVANREGEGLYALAAGAAQAYLEHEIDLIALLLERLREGAQA